MNNSKTLANLTLIGTFLGVCFPVSSILIDMVYREYPWTIASMKVLYASNPLHYVILSAPPVLGGTCYLLGKLIHSREQFLKEMMDKTRKETRYIEEYIRQLASGNFDVQLEESTQNENLGIQLTSLKEHLVREKLEAEKRQWTSEGLAKFGDILRSQSNTEEMAFTIISALVKYLHCNQGALFLLQDDGNELYLELKSCYAYGRKKFLEKRIEPGEGLLGQCYLEKQIILLYEVPEKYTLISSGLGEATPNVLILCPLKVDEKVEGIIELAGFRKFAKHEIDFIERTAEMIGSVFQNIRNNESTRALLESTRHQTEMLRSQEEEMRQNMEELSATQEEMQRKEREYMARLARYRQQFGEIEVG